MTSGYWERVGPGSFHQLGTVEQAGKLDFGRGLVRRAKRRQTFLTWFHQRRVMEQITTPGSLTAKYDPSTGVVRMFGAGLWQMSIVRQHFAELEAALAQARHHHPDVLVFCDLSTASVQMKEVSEEIEQFTERAYYPTDRIAVVLASSVLKMQMRRVVRQATFETFLSASAAYTWLTAHQIPRRHASEVKTHARQSQNAF